MNRQEFCHCIKVGLQKVSKKTPRAGRKRPRDYSQKASSRRSRSSLTRRKTAPASSDVFWKILLFLSFTSRYTGRWRNVLSQIKPYNISIELAGNLFRVVRPDERTIWTIRLSRDPQLETVYSGVFTVYISRLTTWGHVIQNQTCTSEPLLRYGPERRACFVYRQASILYQRSSGIYCPYCCPQ